MIANLWINDSKGDTTLLFICWISKNFYTSWPERFQINQKAWFDPFVLQIIWVESKHIQSPETQKLKMTYQTPLSVNGGVGGKKGNGEEALAIPVSSPKDSGIHFTDGVIWSSEWISTVFQPLVSGVTVFWFKSQLLHLLMYDFGHINLNSSANWR